MLKRLTKIIAMWVLIIMSIGLFAGCVDYGYEYHFSVVGGNGSIVITVPGMHGSIATIEESPSFARGGKRGHGRDFMAIPDDGFQVKEWCLNNEVILDNKSNVCTVEVTKYVNYITVEFEPIK